MAKTLVKISGVIHEAKLFPRDTKGLDTYLKFGPTDNNNEWCTEKKKKIRQKTKPLKKTLKPEWNASFEFILDQPVATMKFEVWDKDKEKVLGHVKFLPPVGSNITGGWFPLTNESEEHEKEIVGEISLNFCWEGSSASHVILKFDVFRQIFAWIEDRALDTEGLFRVPGLESAIQELLASFVDSSQTAESESTDPTFKQKEIIFPNSSSVDTIHTVGGALKLYLRASPSLIPDDFVPLLLQFNDDDRVSTISNAIANLNPLRKNILVLFIAFLRRVAAQSQKNKMDSKNLAMVFSPTLFRASDTNIDMAKLAKEQLVVQTMIDDFDEVFGPNAEAAAIEEEEKYGTTTDPNKENYRVYKRRTNNFRRENVKSIASRSSSVSSGTTSSPSSVPIPPAPPAPPIPFIIRTENISRVFVRSPSGPSTFPITRAITTNQSRIPPAPPNPPCRGSHSASSSPMERRSLKRSRRVMPGLLNFSFECTELHASSQESETQIGQEFASEASITLDDSPHTSTQLAQLQDTVLVQKELIDSLKGNITNLQTELQLMKQFVESVQNKIETLEIRLNKSEETNLELVKALNIVLVQNQEKTFV